jgi:hypothetical protein
LAAADRTGADVEPPTVESGHRDSEADPFRPDPIGHRDADAFHDHLSRRLRAPAHLFLDGAETQARRLLVDQERRNSRRPTLARARHHEIDIADARAGDELLDAIEHVIVAAAARSRRERRGVGARARLGQAVARDQFHVGEARQIAAFELRRAEAFDDPGNHIMDRQERGDAWIASRQSLEDQRRVETGHAAAAMLFADVDCSHAQGRRLAENVGGKVLLLVPAKRVRRQALIGERFRHVADGEMICSQGEHAFPDFAPL